MSLVRKTSRKIKNTKERKIGIVSRYSEGSEDADFLGKTTANRFGHRVKHCTAEVKHYSFKRHGKVFWYGRVLLEVLSPDQSC